MTASLIGLILAVLFFVVSLLVVRRLEQVRMTATFQSFRLYFAGELEPAAVTAFLTGLSGLLGPRWRRLFVRPSVVLETSATAQGIVHHLVVPKAQSEMVLGQLRAALPTVVVAADPDHRLFRPSRAAELSLSTGRRSLRSEHPESISAAILATFQPLQPGEAVVLQWLLTPAAAPAPVPSPNRRREQLDGAFNLLEGASVSLVDPEAVRAARMKQSHPLLFATIRLGVKAGPERSRSLLRRVRGAFHVAAAPGIHLRTRPLPSTTVAGWLVQRSLPVVGFPSLLNTAELTGLVGFPLGSADVLGLKRPTGLLPPSPLVPTTGKVLATATFPGNERPLALGVTDALRHLHVIGPTGVGKTTLLGSVIVQDMAAGRSVVVIDPKGDLITDVLDRVPPDRVEDVIVLDLSDDQRLPGLNLLAGSEKSPELVADQLLGICHRLWANWWGVRTADVLQAALLSLAHQPGTTLCDLPLLLTNASFRRRLVGGLDDPLGLGAFWSWYESLSAPERAQVIGPVMNKLRQLLLRRQLRALLGQAEPTFTLDQVLSERKILLVSLAKGLMGDEAAALVGALVVAALWQAIQGRAALPAAERNPAFVYADEFQDYVMLPTDLGEVLAQARGFGVGLTMAHQHLAQLPADLRQAVLANARTKMVFQAAAADAGVLAREMGATVTPAHLQTLGAYEVVLAIAAGGRVTPATTGRTHPLPPSNGAGRAVRTASRERYGRDREEVEAAIRARHSEPASPGPLRRKKRTGGQS